MRSSLAAGSAERLAAGLDRAGSCRAQRLAAATAAALEGSCWGCTPGPRCCSAAALGRMGHGAVGESAAGLSQGGQVSQREPCALCARGMPSPAAAEQPSRWAPQAGSYRARTGLGRQEAGGPGGHQVAASVFLEQRRQEPCWAVPGAALELWKEAILPFSALTDHSKSIPQDSGLPRARETGMRSLCPAEHQERNWCLGYRKKAESWNGSAWRVLMETYYCVRQSRGHGGARLLGN